MNPDATLLQGGQPLLLRARQLLTMNADPDALREPPPAGDLARLRERDARITGLIEDGAVLVEGDRIAWVGPWAAVPKADLQRAHLIEVDCVTPGWIDCHTHAVFAGSRHDEFTLRNLGARYLDILAAGGGILSSVKSARAARRRDLTNLLIQRCFDATRRGITTLEVKSGYGLHLDAEIKQLQAIQEARPEVLLDLDATFLGAHVVPAELRDRREVYIDKLCHEMIPEVARRDLARFCDVFCDQGAFTAAEAERILLVGAEHGLIPRIHADELSDAGGALLAARLGAASADHLEFITDDAIAALASARVVAVLLPGVNLFLQMERHAPARALLEAGVQVALSTDFNPGTSCTQDLGLILTLACTGYKMTPGEALVGVTRAAAAALRRSDRGVLAPGMRADLTVLGLEDYWQIPYMPGHNFIEGVIRAGELMYWVSAEELHEQD
jgi:imidazolonepropionase